MERIVIVGYRPFAGKETELRELLASHYEILKRENLVSPRKPILMVSRDGTMVEVFGWASKQAMDEAHYNKVILDMWSDFEKVCEYVPVGELPESLDLFSEFSPL